jgi:serine/threonine-protein kinase RsbW
VREKAEILGVDPILVNDIVLAVDEAVTNIIIHGYAGQPGDIEIRVTREADALVVQLEDEAPAFDPQTVTKPDLSLSLEERPLGGMGVFLMNELMDQVRHSVTSQGRNKLTLIKDGVL